MGTQSITCTSATVWLWRWLSTNIAAAPVTTLSSCDARCQNQTPRLRAHPDMTTQCVCCQCLQALELPDRRVPRALRHLVAVAAVVVPPAGVTTESSRSRTRTRCTRTTFRRRSHHVAYFCTHVALSALALGRGCPRVTCVIAATYALLAAFAAAIAVAAPRVPAVVPAAIRSGWGTRVVRSH